MAESSRRTALVTGANRGLGLETCRQLSRAGWRVLLTSRTETGKAAAERLSAEGPAVEYMSLDVVDGASLSALADRLRQGGVRLDALVLNAGISMNGFGPDVAKTTLEVNFFGALRVMEGLLPFVADGGNVVMVSSGLGELSCLGPALREKFLDPSLTRDGVVKLARSFVEEVERGRHGEAGWPSSAYAVSKVAMNAIVRVLAPQLARRGVRLNAVSPGWARTDMGGRGAPRSVEQGAASIVWAAVLGEGGATGGFYCDGEAVPW